MDFEIKKQLEAARKILEDLRESLDFAGREAQIAELEEIVAQPGFWDKPDEAQQIMACAAKWISLMRCRH